jgi:hypothetical protein
MVYVQPQERKRKSKDLAAFGNAVLSGAGVGATVELSKYVANNADKLLYNDIRSGYKYAAGNEPKLHDIPKFTTKIIRKFQKLGELMFKEGGFVDRMLKKTAPHWEGEPAADFAKKITSYKGNVAMGLVAGVTALAIIAHGFYKAGKINGEAQ